MALTFESFVKQHMRKGKNLVPGRLQAALVLLERLRETPSLVLDSHKQANSSGLLSHETYGKRARTRLGLPRLNKNDGRRSSNIGGWGQDLLDNLKASGFETASLVKRIALIDESQRIFAELIRSIQDDEPIKVRLKDRSAEGIIREVLKQAEAKGKTGDVAQYLVAAKLMLRLGRDIPVVGSNLGDRKSHRDTNTRTGDFEIENATIEVAIGVPDEKHLSQVVDILEGGDREIWLLTRQDRVAIWHNELSKNVGLEIRRVVVAAVESFVGQNITEMGEFSSRGKTDQLHRLFKLYNERWVDVVGSPGIRIEAK